MYILMTHKSIKEILLFGYFILKNLYKTLNNRSYSAFRLSLIPNYFVILKQPSFEFF